MVSCSQPTIRPPSSLYSPLLSTGGTSAWTVANFCLGPRSFSMPITSNQRLLIPLPRC